MAPLEYYEPGEKGHKCPNCHSDLQGSVRYCPECGQKDRKTRIRFRDLIYEFITNVLNIDAQVYQSFWYMPIPARLTHKFFEGQRKRFIHPIRLFLFSALVLIAMISLAIHKQVEKIPNMAAEWQTDLMTKETILLLDSLRKKLPSPESEVADSALFRYLQHSGKIGQEKDLSYLDSMDFYNTSSDTQNIILFNIIGKNPKKMEDRLIRFHKRDLMELPEEEVVVLSKADNLLDKIIVRQTIKFYKDTRSAVRFGIGSILWSFLMLIPTIAFFQYFLFGFRKYFYVEHIVFGIHTHSVLFLTGSAAIAIQYFTGGFESYPILIGAFGLWLLISMRMYYRRTWIRTIFNFLIINFIYSILAMFYLGFSVLLRFMLF